MNFGDILDQWDKRTGSVYYKDVIEPRRTESSALRRRRLLRKRPDATLDLHGQTGNEAWVSLDGFFNHAKQNRLEKLLIIHGKGNHSFTNMQEPVLKKTVRDYIERCPFAGESGTSNSADGGSGSTWVLLKNRE